MTVNGVLQLVLYLLVLLALVKPLGWFMARVDQRQAADPAGFEQMKGSFSGQLLQQRQQLFFESFVNELRTKAKVRDLRGEGQL